MSEPAWIETIDEEEATGKVAEAYEICGTTTGRVAHIYKVHSLNPRALLDHRTLYRTLIFGPSPLKRYQREMIGTVVASLYDCHY